MTWRFIRKNFEMNCRVRKPWFKPRWRVIFRTSCLLFVIYLKFCFSKLTIKKNKEIKNIFWNAIFFLRKKIEENKFDVFFFYYSSVIFDSSAIVKKKDILWFFAIPPLPFFLFPQITTFIFFLILFLEWIVFGIIFAKK